MRDFSSLFQEAFRSCGAEAFATEENARLFEELTVLLQEANRTMNLTAISSTEEIVYKHFADCAATAHLLPEGAKVLDVGCGGGFPTLPLAIVRKDLTITALDSTVKKLSFVQKAGDLLGLRVKILPGRAEELGREKSLRESFDAVTARAVAALPVLSEWCLPFVKVGGVFVAMKGAAGREELQAAENALPVLGARVEAVEELEAERIGKRINLLIRKVSPTPGAYPRKNALILKKPL